MGAEAPQAREQMESVFGLMISEDDSPEADSASCDLIAVVRGGVWLSSPLRAARSSIYCAHCGALHIESEVGH
jgi:hypothetical protein